MAEYKLSFKANEIDEKLRKIDDLSVFVTPQMFGAKGDGVTDDTAALAYCFSENVSGETINLLGKIILLHMVLSLKMYILPMVLSYTKAQQTKEFLLCCEIQV